MRANNRFDIDSIAWSKFDPTLQKAITSLQADPTVELPVMIALNVSNEPQTSAREGRPSREERARLAVERQVAFEREVGDFVHELERFDVSNLQLFWINSTVSGRMTLPALEVAGSQEKVKQIVLAVRRIALH